MRNNPKLISAIPPSPYMERFLNFMNINVFPKKKKMTRRTIFSDDIDFQNTFDSIFR